MKLITIRTFDNSFEAHLLKSRLESEGINCILADEHTVSLNILFNITLGGIKLNIEEKDLEKALEIVSLIDNTPLTDEEDNIISCPDCESQDLYSGVKSMKGAKGFLSALASFLFFIYPLYFKTVYKCKNCGKEFKV